MNKKSCWIIHHLLELALFYLPVLIFPHSSACQRATVWVTGGQLHGTETLLYCQRESPLLNCLGFPCSQQSPWPRVCLGTPLLQPVKLIWSLLTEEDSKDTSSSNHFSDTLVCLCLLSRPLSRVHKCAKDRAQKTASKMECLHLMHW